MYKGLIDSLLSNKDKIQYLLDNGFKLKNLSSILHNSGAYAAEVITALCKKADDIRKLKEMGFTATNLSSILGSSGPNAAEAITALCKKADDIRKLKEMGFTANNLSSILHNSGANAAEAITALCDNAYYLIKLKEKDFTADNLSSILYRSGLNAGDKILKLTLEYGILPISTKESHKRIKIKTKKQKLLKKFKKEFKKLDSELFPITTKKSRAMGRYLSGEGKEKDDSLLIKEWLKLYSKKGMEGLKEQETIDKNEKIKDSDISDTGFKNNNDTQEVQRDKNEVTGMVSLDSTRDMNAMSVAQPSKKSISQKRTRSDSNQDEKQEDYKIPRKKLKPLKKITFR